MTAGEGTPPNETLGGALTATLGNAAMESARTTPPAEAATLGRSETILAGGCGTAKETRTAKAAGVRPGGAVAGWIRRASVPAERGGGRTTRSESSSVVWLEIWTLGAVLLPPRCGPISTPEMSATTAAADSIVDAGLEIVMNVSHACPSVQAIGCALSTTGPRR